MTKNILQPSVLQNADSPHQPSPEVDLAIKQSYQLSRQSFISPSFLPRTRQLCEIKRRLNLSPVLSVKSSIFGVGMLLSSLDNKMIVTMLSDAGSEVFQNVFSSILSGSEMLDIESVNEAEEYFFIKEENQYLNDLEELERLSGSYNVTNNSQRGGGEQVWAPPTPRDSLDRDWQCFSIFNRSSSTGGTDLMVWWCSGAASPRLSQLLKEDLSHASFMSE